HQQPRRAGRRRRRPSRRPRRLGQRRHRPRRHGPARADHGRGRGVGGVDRRSRPRHRGDARARRRSDRHPRGRRTGQDGVRRRRRRSLGEELGMILAVIIGAVAVVGLAFLIGAVKIVRPYQRGLVERLGRYKTTKEPGFNLIIPFIETMQLVDMREQLVDVLPQEVITADNVVVSVDAVVYYEATDPQRLIYNVADFFTAITKLAQTNLRNLIGDLELDTALTSRDRINTQLREVLDDATDKWGV